MKLFEHRDVIRIYPDLKTRTLISWSEKGLFSPASPPDGPGRRRKYSEENLLEIGVIRELVSYRFNHDYIRDIMDYLRKNCADDFHDCVIVARLQYSPGARGFVGGVVEINVGSRSNFGSEAAELVFGEQSVSEKVSSGLKRPLAVGSAVVVSVAGIWEFVRERLKETECVKDKL